MSGNSATDFSVSTSPISPEIRLFSQSQLHALGEVGARRLEDQVEVIGQEDKGIQRPSRPPNGAFQASHQPPAVGIVLDDVLLPLPRAMT